MYIFVGLGNPGKKYENTRHNIGFETIDYMARKLDINVKKLKHKALIGEGFYNGEKIVLVKPQTYMNLSGDTVMSLVNYYDVPRDKLVVIYDDIDLATGSLRIRKKGSAGTHNGMKDIIYKLKFDDFPRLRIGVGSSDNIPLKNFVLSGFSKEEVKLVEEAIMNSYEALMLMIDRNIDIAMSTYNTKKEKVKVEKSE